jgi:hypothetical protein
LHYELLRVQRLPGGERTTRPLFVALDDAKQSAAANELVARQHDNATSRHWQQCVHEPQPVDRGLSSRTRHPSFIAGLLAFDEPAAGQQEQFRLRSLRAVSSAGLGFRRVAAGAAVWCTAARA